MQSGIGLCMKSARRITRASGNLFTIQVVSIKGLVAGTTRVPTPLVAARAGSRSPLRLQASMMRRKMVTWWLSDSLCSICLVISLAHLPCLVLIARKASMNSLPGVTLSGMTAPKGIGTMLGKAASAISSGALSQVVPRSNSAGRGIVERIAKGISLWFWIAKDEPMQSLLILMKAGSLLLLLMFPAMAMRLSAGDLMGRGLKMTTNSFSWSMPAKAAMLFESTWMAAKLLFVQVRKPNSGGFGAGFEAVGLRGMLTRDICLREMIQRSI
jgi:hypothetical protein